MSFVSYVGFYLAENKHLKLFLHMFSGDPDFGLSIHHYFNVGFFLSAIPLTLCVRHSRSVTKFMHNPTLVSAKAISKQIKHV